MLPIFLLENAYALKGLCALGGHLPRHQAPASVTGQAHVFLPVKQSPTKNCQTAKANKIVITTPIREHLRNTRSESSARLDMRLQNTPLAV